MMDSLAVQDKDPCSRWEYVRTLLEALIENEPWSCDRSPPTAAEAKNHVVAYLVCPDHIYEHNNTPSRLEFYLCSL